MSWACWLKRVFDIDIESCPRCGGRLKIIAAIVDPQVIIKILTHLGLPARAPPQRTGAALPAVPSGLTLNPQDRLQHLSRRARSSCARASAPMRLDTSAFGS